MYLGIFRGLFLLPQIKVTTKSPSYLLSILSDTDSYVTVYIDFRIVLVSFFILEGRKWKGNRGKLCAAEY